MGGGNLQNNEGFEIWVNNVPRTFRDLKDTALSAARMLKAKHRNAVIEIRDRATGARQIVFDDGRLA
jgi:hypothetical protein